MAKGDASLLSLLAHPDMLENGVRRVAAGADLAGPDGLRFQYVLEADPRLIRLPPPVADAGRTDKLWTHTCFEAFVGFPGSSGYLELNFSPSGQWAAYRFDSYRQGMAPALEAAPRLVLRRLTDRLELQAEVRLGVGMLAPAQGPNAPQPRLRVALSMVVEDLEGRLSYWALRHPAGRPDFHHAEGFSLALELPSQPASPL
ncbi:MAG: DOMON-like domain-containing protein [Steroidobacteraceae bacterium]